MSNKKYSKRKTKLQKLQRANQIPTNQNKIQVRSQFTSGPIPSAEVLAAYESTLPGAADRIIKMAENQANHRSELEKLAIKGNIEKEYRGQWFGFIIGMSGIISSIAVIYSGFAWPGAVMGSSSIFGLATVFVVGKKKVRKEIESKPKPR